MIKRYTALLTVLLVLAAALCGCGQSPLDVMQKYNTAPAAQTDDNYRTTYEVFVYSFCDSNGDGVGDLQGLISKLDYIDELGCTQIWLMPVMPSTTYHKYDVTDYEDIDAEYGTLADFDLLIKECHARNINVIIDLVMNHSSSKHPWFKEAVSYLQQLPEDEMPSASDCAYFDYYNFREGPAKGYAQVPATGTRWYYEAQFWSEMPDLNLSSEAVRGEFDEITSFWLDRGADGFRLDAVKEFTSGDTNANVEVLTWFTDMVKAKKSDCYIVGECWTNTDTYAQYYASGMDSLFDFAFSDSQGIITTSVNKSNAERYAKSLVSSQELFASYNPDYINAPFYTNHDQGRSAGYYPGEEGMAKVKVAQALNLLMSGNAFLYYGEELGMKGSGKDENKRAPMYWSKDDTAQGMCDGPSGMEHVEMKYDSLEEQQKDDSSIYNYVKQVLALRNAYPEISHGEVTYYEELSTKSLAVISKEYEGSTIYLALNLGTEAATCDVSALLGSDCDSGNIAGVLITDDISPKLKGGKLSVPGYGIVLLK